MRFDSKSISAFDGGVLLGFLACVFFVGITGPLALLCGLALALSSGKSLHPKLKPWISHLLGGAITLLGAGIPLREVLSQGGRGLGVSLVLIAGTLLLGRLLSRRIGVDAATGTLISAGTAICGGSAIAAVAVAISAPAEATAVSLAIVFSLNALAVWIFPEMGHLLQLTGEQFGVWSALAVHDTSSVIAAAVSFGAGAETVAVPMKLARALWILPVSLVFAGGFQKGKRGVKLPWFVLSFVLFAALFSAFPEWGGIAQSLSSFGKRLLVGVLFGVGLTVSRDTFKKAGSAPFVLALVLWVVVSVTSLIAVLEFKSL